MRVVINLKQCPVRTVRETQVFYPNGSPCLMLKLYTVQPLYSGHLLPAHTFQEQIGFIKNPYKETSM